MDENNEIFLVRLTNHDGVIKLAIDVYEFTEGHKQIELGKVNVHNNTFEWLYIYVWLDRIDDKSNIKDIIAKMKLEAQKIVNNHLNKVMMVSSKILDCDISEFNRH